MALTIFYDSQCPLCVQEMGHLLRYDHDHQIQLADIHDEAIYLSYPELDPARVRERLHAQNEEGQWLYGLDVTYEAWRRVGKRCWVAPLRWRLVRPISDRAYLWFARNRHWLSRALAPEGECKPCRVPEQPKSCDSASRTP